MPSPLDLSSTAARAARDSARAHFEQAAKDVQLVAAATVVLGVTAIVLAATRGIAWYYAFVLVGAIALFVSTKNRRDRLERRLWWNQARAGLVDALEEQSRSRASAVSDPVVDLRSASSKVSTE